MKRLTGRTLDQVIGSVDVDELVAARMIPRWQIAELVQIRDSIRQTEEQQCAEYDGCALQRGASFTVASTLQTVAFAELTTKQAKTTVSKPNLGWDGSFVRRIVANRHR